MRILTTIFRVIAAITFSIIWLGVIPIYGGPFASCEISGYLTLQAGCSDWPIFLRGFGFVLIAAVIAPSKTGLHYVAFIIIGAVTLIGGFEGWRSGLYYEIKDFDDMLYMALGKSPLAVGGLVALLLFLSGKKFIDKHKTSCAA